MAIHDTSTTTSIEPWLLHARSFMLARRYASSRSSCRPLSASWPNAPRRRRLTILAIETSCDDVRTLHPQCSAYNS